MSGCFESRCRRKHAPAASSDESFSAEGSNNRLQATKTSRASSRLNHDGFTTAPVRPPAEQIPTSLSFGEVNQRQAFELHAHKDDRAVRVTQCLQRRVDIQWRLLADQLLRHGADRGEGVDRVISSYMVGMSQHRGCKDAQVYVDLEGYR